MIGEEEGSRIREKLVRENIFSLPEIPGVSLEDGKTTYGYGYPVKAFEKFLGYFDPEKHIPYTPSISFNNDFSVCQSTCTYRKDLKDDVVIFDGQSSEKYYLRAKKALDNFRSLLGIDAKFQFVVQLTRRYDRAKGLSESSAVAASVSRSLLRNVFSSEPDERLVSRFAKFVSGSGTRSSIPGVSMWLSYPGISEQECFAVRLPVDYSRFHFAAIPLHTDIATSDMHKLVVKSPLYIPWITEKYQKIEKIVDSGFLIEDLMNRGFEEMISLSNLIKSVGQEIHTADTLTIIEKFLEYRRRNGNIYMTTDTGPSTIIMSTDKSILDGFLDTLPYSSLRGRVMDTGDPETRSEFMKKSQEEYGI